MSEIKSESISSLVDNYSSSIDDTVITHLVDNMLKDEALLDTWQNYHLIGDVLREETSELLPFDLSDQISVAIAQEATVLSPNTSTQNPNHSINTVKDESDSISLDSQTVPVTNVVDASSRFKKKLSQLMKPMGQVAIAASAAVLMIVGVQDNVTDNSSFTPNKVVQTVPLFGHANPVSFNVQPTQPDINQSAQLQTEKTLNEKRMVEKFAQQRRLQALLKDHNQQVVIGGKIK